MKLVSDTLDCRIYHGLAEQWRGPEQIDFVFTNPYGYIPISLIRTPMIIHQWIHRKGEAEKWCGNKLDFMVSSWNDDREAFWSANVLNPSKLNLRNYRPEPGGWYPEDLARAVLKWYVRPGQTVWDGFMGRGTIAKICRELGIKYVGVEELAAHIEIAKTYLGIDTLA